MTATTTDGDLAVEPTMPTTPARPRSFGWLIRLTAAVMLLLVWQLVARTFFEPQFFPAPTDVAVAAWRMVLDGSLLEGSFVSLARILGGFLIGCVLGVPIGLLMGSFERVSTFVGTYVEFFRFIPSIAWLTPAIIWFGVGETPKIFIIVYTTIFVVIISTTAGVANIPVNKLRAGESLGASRLQMFGQVTFPAAVPHILTGMRIAIANSFTTVVAAEMIAASQGLGYLIWTSRVYFATDVVFVGMVSLGLLGFLFDRLFLWLINRFAGQFHDR